MSWDIFSKSKIQYFLEKLKDKFVQKETGKGLSTNDYTTAEKNKVATIDNKADKVSSATNGNLAGLNGTGNLTDSGWNGAKDTTSISGNPISISGLKANQLAKNPIITLEPIQAGSGTPSPSNIRAISGYDKIEVLSCGKNLVSGRLSGYAINTNGTFATNINYDMVYAPVVKGASYVISSDNNAVMGWFEDKPTALSQAYDATRYSYAVGIAYTAPITGWVAFRTVAGYTTPQVEYGATQTSYVAPNKTTDLSESLGQTVYGGTLDVRTGVLTGNMLLAVYDGSSDEAWESYSGQSNSVRIPAPTNAKGTSQLNISNMYLYGSIATDKQFSLSQTWLYVRDSSNISSVSAWKTFLSNNPLVVCYEVLTPFTIQLTPHEISLLKDYAYVSTNGTNIALDYHNGELASLGDVSQLGETVNELGEYINIEHNEFDTAVDISSATASSRYTFPSDGYIFINGRNNTSGYIRAYAYGRQSNAIAAGISVNITGTQQMASLYVRKGMRCYIDTNVTGFNAQFIPLV